MNYYERHLGDYARDTAHLSLLEHGVYTLLLDRYYVTEKPLPSNERDLFRLLRAASKAEKDAVRQVLREFFTETPEGWRQRRCDEVIADYHDGEPDREARRANDKARQTRHRELRSKMFEQLRAVGIVPEWNVTTDHLRALVTKHCNGTSHDPSRVTVTAPVTPATATHSHFPLPSPTSQNPEPVDTSSPPVCVSADSARETTRAQGGKAREGHPEPDHRAGFAAVRAAYPTFAGRQDWIAAEHHARRLIDLGTADWPTLRAAVERYAAFIAAGGVSGPQYVLTPGKFFGAADEPWRQPWAIPAPFPEAVPARRRKTAAEYEAEARARGEDPWADLPRASA